MFSSLWFGFGTPILSFSDFWGCVSFAFCLSHLENYLFCAGIFESAFVHFCQWVCGVRNKVGWARLVRFIWMRFAMSLCYVFLEFVCALVGCVSSVVVLLNFKDE